MVAGGRARLLAAATVAAVATWVLWAHPQPLSTSTSACEAAAAAAVSSLLHWNASTPSSDAARVWTDARVADVAAAAALPAGVSPGAAAALWAARVTVHNAHTPLPSADALPRHLASVIAGAVCGPPAAARAPDPGLTPRQRHALHAWLAGVAGVRAARRNATTTARVVVAGGGPVGLLSAVAAIQAGAACVTVVEARATYRRDLWFDLAPATVAALAAWGFSPAAAHCVTHDGFAGVCTVRCQVLERFLQRTAVLAGAVVLHATLTNDSSVAVAPVSVAVTTASSPQRVLPADVLLACDGAHSTVRAGLGWSFDVQGTVAPVAGGPTALAVPHLHQVTLLARLAPTVRTSSCPPLRVTASGDVVDPFSPSFHLPGVTSVFKRWFAPFCELQVLVDVRLGRRLEARMAQRLPVQLDPTAAGHATAWNLLLHVVNHVVEVPYPSVPRLQAAMDPSYAPRVLRLETRRAPSTVVLVTPVCRGGGGGGGGVVMLRGDAAITPHYRLGIGVNNAVAGLHEVADVVGSWPPGGGYSALRPVVEAAEAAAQRRLDAMAAVQLHAMYHEAHCGRAVGDGAVFVKHGGEYVEAAGEDLVVPCHDGVRRVGGG